MRSAASSRAWSWNWHQDALRAGQAATHGWTSPGCGATPAISPPTTSTAACASTSAGCATGNRTDNRGQPLRGQTLAEGYGPMTATGDERTVRIGHHVAALPH